MQRKIQTIQKDYNIHQIPSNPLELWKWIAGVENALDRKALNTYQHKLLLLQSTQPTSIFHLNNLIITLWHTSAELTDYATFKARQRLLAKASLIRIIFLRCIKLLLQLYYNDAPSLRDLPEQTLTSGLKLDSLIEMEKLILSLQPHLISVSLSL